MNLVASEHGYLTPRQARDFLLTDTVTSNPAMVELKKRLSSDRSFLIDLHGLITKYKGKGIVNERLVLNLAILFEASPQEFFERFVSSIERGSFKLYYQPFMKIFEQKVFNARSLVKVVQLLVKHNDYLRLEKLFLGEGRQFEEQTKKALQKTCIVAVKLATKEVQLEILDILFTFLNLSTESEFHLVLSHLQDSYPLLLFVENASVKVLRHFLLKGRVVGINEILLIRRCRALNVAVKHFIKTHPDPDESVKLQIVKHVLEFGYYEPIVYNPLYNLDDHYRQPVFLSLLDPLSLNVDSYMDLIQTSPFENSMRLECFFAYRVKQDQLFCTQDFVQKVMLSVKSIDERTPRLLLFLIRYFIDTKVDFGNAVVHQPLSIWNFYLLCVYEKGPHIPFNFRNFLQETTPPIIVKLICSVFVAEGWTQKEWHRTLSIQIRFSRKKIFTKINKFLFKNKVKPTLNDCYLTSRILEEDLFHSATSFDDYQAIDGKRVIEAIKKIFSENVPRALGFSLMESLHNRFPLGFCSTKKATEITIPRIEATITQVCKLLLLVQIRPSCSDRRENEHMVCYKVGISKDLILYITEFLPMSKARFFRLFVNPFLSREIPEEIIFSLFQRLCHIRNLGDTPFHIQSPILFCNKLRDIAKNQQHQQSADVVNKKALILFHVKNYIRPVSSKLIIEEMNLAIEDGSLSTSINPHLLTGILRDAGNTLSRPWPLTKRQMEEARVTWVYGFMNENMNHWAPFKNWYNDFCTILGVKI